MRNCRFPVFKSMGSEVATVRKTVLYFGFLAFLFHILFLLHISLYGRTPFAPFLFPSLPHGWVLEWSLSCFFSIIALRLLELHSIFTKYLYYLYERISFLRSHRLKCFHTAKQKGITKWQWYAASWIGFIWFLLSMIFSAWIQKSYVVLTAGVVGWWGSLHWQIFRERYWLKEQVEEKIDFLSFSKFSIFFLLMYVVPIHLNMYLDHDVHSFPFSGLIMILYSLWIFPTWAHFLLGKRPFILKSFIEGDQGGFSNTSMFYDDFGGMISIVDTREKRGYFSFRRFDFLFFCAVGVWVVFILIKKMVRVWIP
ncbi:hypothetical protein [Pasteuria penetrans]|uniref:hypothetical protein n=1 Tax=Pasteuria penetrans TaxID=86005 RepID=UPI000FAEE118|nr:hypothetical protein [Pasteuria penetrans]